GALGQVEVTGAHTGQDALGPRPRRYPVVGAMPYALRLPPGAQPVFGRIRLYPGRLGSGADIGEPDRHDQRGAGPAIAPAGELGVEPFGRTRADGEHTGQPDPGVEPLRLGYGAVPIRGVAQRPDGV